MKTDIQNLDLFDALSERHHQIRSISEKLWNDSNNIYLSNSEWFILSRIYQKQPTISYVSKHVDISRQATHKFIKKLESKGLVEINSMENNKKDKCLKLTKLGEECYEQNELLKANIEKTIIDSIGEEKVNLLKEILKSDWGIEANLCPYKNKNK